MWRTRLIGMGGVVLVFGLAGTSAAQETSRWLLGVSAAVQAPIGNFQDNVRFELNAENGDLSADYRIGTGVCVDGGGAVRVWRRLVAGVDVSYFQKDSTVSVDARLPHPFFFNRPRTVMGEADALRRTEVGVHVLAGWLVPLGERFDVLLSGGPSYIHLRQPFVERVAFQETFPFNSATFTGVSTTTIEKGGVGAHVGADLIVRFHRHFGIGSRARFTWASIKTFSPDRDELDLDAGGLQLLAGFRARF